MEMRGTAIIGVAFGHGRADFGQLGLVAFDDSDDDFGPRPNVLHVEPEIRVEWAAHTGAALRRCCCTKIINSRFHDRNWALTCGGAKGTRTPGLLVANQTLFQLSYSPAWSRVLQTRSGQARSRWTVAVWYWYRYSALRNRPAHVWAAIASGTHASRFPATIFQHVH